MLRNKVAVLTAALLTSLTMVVPTADAQPQEVLLVEGESLVTGGQATAPLEAQPNCCGLVWSGGAQLWLRGTRAGDRVTGTVSVSSAGRYTLSAVLTGAPDYGIVRLSVDNIPVGQPFDAYRTAVTVSTANLGTVALTAGTHSVSLELLGKSSRSTGYFAGLDKLTLTSAGPVPAVSMVAYETTGADVSAGAFFRVYDPSVGETSAWYYNDHTMIRDVVTGTWHVFAITHAEPANPLDEKAFGHATAPSPRGPWTKRPFALTASPGAGESHIWAPHVIHDNGRYYMFYAAGTPDHAAYRIHLATSTDLTTWTRSGANPLFTDGFDARDPMVTKVGQQWVMYYTANNTPQGGNHQVAYRTSTDLVHWSGKQVAFEHPAAGTFGGPTESPFVVRRDDWWYLFVCCDPGYKDGRVYRSRDPLRFSVHDLAGRVNAHAAEVVTEPDGTTWITGAGWGQGGLHLAPLSFNPAVVARGHRITTPSLTADVRHWPTSELRELAVDPTAAGNYRKVLDNSARSTGPYLSVGRFAFTDTAGAATEVRVSPDGTRISLLGIPFGDEPVRADWTLGFASAQLDQDLSWRVTGNTTAPVWEAALGFDTTTATVGDPQNLDRDSEDVPSFPRWLLAGSPELTLAAAYRTGSAWATDNHWFLRRHGLMSVQSLWSPGGKPWPVGVYPGGRWLLGFSGIPSDTGLANRLATEVNQ